MNRRLFLLTGLGTGIGAALAGCAGNPHPADTGQVVLPSNPTARIAAYVVWGGFVAPGHNELNPAHLAVFADGTAVADAAFQLTLPAQEAAALVAALRRDLAGLPPSPPPLGKNMIADAATTTLTVLDAGGKTVAVSAYALDMLQYPAALERARDRLSALAQRVTEGAKPYVAQRIRLVAVPQPGSGTASNWPDGVPVPGEKIGMVRVADVSGAAAQVARTAFRRGSDGSWAVFTVGSQTLSVAWRYLLPDE